MKIRYRCIPCDVDRELDVRERKEGETIEAFVSDIVSTVGFVHKLENPTCDHGQVDLLLPVTPEGKIGGYRVPESIEAAK